MALKWIKVHRRVARRAKEEISEHSEETSGLQENTKHFKIRRLLLPSNK